MPNNNGIAVLQLNFGSRLYFQQSDNKIYELCWDGKDGDQWYRGGDGGDAICTARPDTPIAVTKIDTFNGIIPGDQIIHLYYVGTDDYVKEHVFKDGKWAPGANLESASVPQGTSLAAVGWGLDLPNIRVYYQGYGGTVQELLVT
ncbi:hypothetical protein BT96DRAFT_345283 [Gymnopus androsaceus JB14]|uniref:Uncharacterized protein n=1 Tax=Gymnopus androsaceus JB14 TaxID=1447944 RepID=A0A6A4GZF3_9AGAR|nr:hypothetical protein BT96DRAFT_345283 [Gymnopus androsaceus JB14]